MNQEQSQLGTKPIGKLLLSYSIPGIIGMMVTALYNIVDRIFIGHMPLIGAQAISGIGVTMPITTIILAFGMLVGMGATANISLHLGRGEKHDAEKILGNALSMSLFLSAILTIVGILFLDQFLNLFGASEQIMGYAKDYIYIIILGTIFNITGFAMNNTIRADGSPIIAGLTMVVGCVINIILDPIFIFTFNMGIKGAAIATVLSQIISFLWIAYYYFGGKSKMKITLSTLKPNFKYIGIIIAIGMSPFSMQIATSVVQGVLNNQLQVIGGDNAIGAFTIISSIAMLFMMAIFGINQGGQPIIGYNYGAKNYKRVRKTFYATVIVGTVYLIFGFLITQFFPEILVKLLNDDAELLAITTQGIRINLFTLPLLAVCVMGSTFFQNIGKARVSILLSLLRQVLLLIPALLILPHFFGLTGVWIAQPICDVITFVIVSGFIFYEFRKMKLLEDLPSVTQRV